VYRGGLIRRCVEQVWLWYQRLGGVAAVLGRSVMDPGWLDCQYPPWITLGREAVLRGMKHSSGQATRYLASQQWMQFSGLSYKNAPMLIT
jgi:hypothetical protein